jgi:hypothetical protein
VAEAGLAVRESYNDARGLLGPVRRLGEALEGLQGHMEGDSRRS